VKKQSRGRKRSPAKRKSAALALTQSKNTELVDAGSLYKEVRAILDEARGRAARLVNVEMVRAYWLVGQAIVNHEQRGRNRAGYGEQLIESLAARLTAEFTKGFQSRNLWWMRDFYLKFPKLNALRSELSWTHYRLLLKVDGPEARSFYEQEAAEQNWSTRELERQISSMLYERTALSTRKGQVMTRARSGAEKYAAQDFVKDPYVLEFLGLKQSPALSESQLETALLDHLQEFLLELGKGFSFVARQQRITIEGDHFYLDLVFYNRLLRAFVLIDLKIGKLTHRDIGQMQMYVNYYTREVREEWEAPAMGILLCAEKNDAVVRYILPEGERQIFASRYQLYLPSEQELAAELSRERELLELRSKIESDKGA
jgi:predicted nuclease of restriction endonuclease-like (RecB) superfamily